MFQATFVYVVFLIHLTIAEYPQFYELNINYVEEVSEEEFFENILNSNRVTILQFYANWCINSKKFRLQWVKFAKETRLWQQHVLRVAAIDCFMYATNSVCEQNNILEYPQIGLYFARTKNATGLKFNSTSFKIENFMKSVIDLIEKQRHPSREWPSLFPYT